MRYFVVAADGQRYGPADLGTLQQWVAEGRVLPTSLLEEEIGGARLQASGLAGITFTQAAPPYSAAPPNPYGQGPNPYSTGQQYPQQPDQNQYSQNPYASGNYYRGGGGHVTGGAQRSLNTSWTVGAIGLGILTIGWCCIFGPLASIALTIWGTICGKQAKEAGHPNGTSAFVFNIVILVLSVLALAFVLMIYGMGRFDSF